MHTFRTVSDIRIESGGTARLDQHVKSLGAGNRIAIITDPGVRKLGLLDAGLAALQDARYTVLVFDQVQADPPEEVVLHGAEIVRDFDPDLIIGFGGGSPMDTAKVIAHLVGCRQSLSQMYGVGLAKGPRIPLLLIPTTAGTGSEVTNVAVLTTGKTEKMAVVADVLYADRVLLDADLTLGLPKLTSAATGIDAMVHAIEAYTSKLKKNPLSDALALSAMGKLRGAIERVCLDGRDREARNDMLIGSMLAGQAFSNAPVAAVHALAYPLGGFFHIPHGLSNALVLTEVLKYNQPKAEQAYGEIADHLRIGSTGSALIDDMQRIKNAVDVPQTLRSVDIKADAIPMMAKDAMTKDRILINNPREMSYEAVVHIYENIA